MPKIQVAEVVLWGKQIGAVAWDENRNIGNFEYTKEFLKSEIEIAPIVMPLASTIYSFPELANNTFRGLPGLLADCLPDKFGNLLIDQWLVKIGRDRESFSPIERLCYLGKRGMGALEFQPANMLGPNESVPVHLESLVELASEILTRRMGFETGLSNSDAQNAEAINDIIRVGTSAGGARAKAVIAWNQTSNEIRSGQVKAPAGFEYWILKFDGVSGNRDKELEDPKGYGKVEYAYYLMSQAAGIQMMPSRLLKENNRSHFMTKRFDRTDQGHKIHMQSLCAIGHYDYQLAGAYSYEQAMAIMQKLKLSIEDLIQFYRRALFNIIARNQDDHTKNIAFLMDQEGKWSLAPAFDVMYSYNPQGAWTSQHQMSLNGKRDDFHLDDLLALGNRFHLGSQNKLMQIIEQIIAVVEQWPDYAAQAELSQEWMQQIKSHHRSQFL